MKCVDCKYWKIEERKLYPTRDEIRVGMKYWGANCSILPKILDIWIDGEARVGEITTGSDFSCIKFERYKGEIENRAPR